MKKTLNIFFVLFIFSIEIQAKCTEEQRADMILNNISQNIIEKKCTAKNIKVFQENKNIPIQIKQNLNEKLRLLISLDIGGTSGKLDVDTTIESRAVTQEDSFDYDGINFRIATGLAIPHRKVESRIKIFAERENGKVTFSPLYNNMTNNVSNIEGGLNYELIFSKRKVRPLIGIKLSVGESKPDGSESLSYVGFGVYGGVLFQLSYHFDLSLNLGFKIREYETYNYTYYGYQVTNNSSYGGVDAKIGGVYKF